MGQNLGLHKDTPCLKIHREDPPTREKENIQERGRFLKMQEGWILKYREEGPHVGYNKKDGWDGFACVRVGNCEFLFDDFQTELAIKSVRFEVSEGLCGGTR